jgi:uncharacterized DUF497 family protein
MKHFEWNNEKNEQLMCQRNICFEDVLVAMESGYLLDVVQNQNYENQKIFIVKIKGYAYLVPFVEDEKTLFFKTIIPSRKATKKYLF